MKQNRLVDGRAARSAAYTPMRLSRPTSAHSRTAFSVPLRPSVSQMC
ncbi:MAG: hypothetical protein ACKERG_00105 [Candidatus Hodgkinia cicadicola]